MNLPIEITGRVAHGRGLGRTFGVPTANVPLPQRGDLKWGVYAAWVRIEGSAHDWPAAASAGVRPTVEADGAPVLECFLIGYSGKELYGKKIFVRLVQYIRAELRFESKELLVEQIGRDVECVRQILQLQ